MYPCEWRIAIPASLMRVDNCLEIAPSDLEATIKLATSAASLGFARELPSPVVRQPNRRPGAPSEAALAALSRLDCGFQVPWGYLQPVIKQSGPFQLEHTLEK